MGIQGRRYSTAFSSSTLGGAIVLGALTAAPSGSCSIEMSYEYALTENAIIANESRTSQSFAQLLPTIEPYTPVALAIPAALAIEAQEEAHMQTLVAFAHKISDDAVETPDKYAKIINDNFWDLI